MWILFATLLAGASIGLLCGMTDEPSAGHVTTGITGFVAGVLGASIKLSGMNGVEATHLSQLFIAYILALMIFYVLGNLLRKWGWTDRLYKRR